MYSANQTERRKFFCIAYSLFHYFLALVYRSYESENCQIVAKLLAPDLTQYYKQCGPVDRK
jgi:hypothetical protein